MKLENKRSGEKVKCLIDFKSEMFLGDSKVQSVIMEIGSRDRGRTRPLEMWRTNRLGQ